MTKVKIYTWTFCMYCNRAKALLNKESIEFEEINIDGNESARMALKDETGSGSVPQIFVDDVFIGGCDELHKLHKDTEAFNRCFGR